MSTKRIVDIVHTAKYCRPSVLRGHRCSQIVCGDLSLPLVFLVDRDWRISEDEAVGTRVARVRVSQESAHLNVTYQLEPSGGQDFTQLFRIDGNTGAVYLNQSVKGRVRGT